MKEIPEGATCLRCDYLYWSDDYWAWFCNYPRDYWKTGRAEKETDDSLTVPLRGASCLSAYPNGADVTIKARSAG